MGKLQSTLRNYFVAGILVLAPIGLTFWLFKVLLGAADRVLQVKDGYFFYLIPAEYHPDALLGFKLPFLGVFISLLLVFMTGVFARNFFGRKLIKVGEDIVRRIPFVRSIYKATKQLFGTVLHQSSRNFREVVLIEYPRKGLYTVGFISGQASGKVQAAVDKTLVGVFIPTTPNPTSGFFLMVPKEDLIHLSISPEEAFKLVISFGIVTPESAEELPEANA